jgi:protoporphyrinogen oxidase
VDDLLKLKVLSCKKEILWTRQREIQYANVIFNHPRSAALSVITSWVNRQGIHLAGRYGEWGYLWSDDATRSGWNAANQILKNGS